MTDNSAVPGSRYICIPQPDLNSKSKQERKPQRQHGGAGIKVDSLAATQLSEFSLLSPDLVKNLFKLTKVYWFDEMKIKSRFGGASNICLSTKATDCDCLDWMLSFRLGDNFVAASIGKTYVAQNYVEFL